MKGFTLIEMLVVVLIIGILASISVPQYQRAVERSRMTEAMVTGKAIIESQNRFLDAYPNGSADTKNALDIKLIDGVWNGDGTIYETILFTYTLTESGVNVSRNAGGANGGYTLQFHNTTSDNAGVVNCTGNAKMCAQVNKLK